MPNWSAHLVLLLQFHMAPDAIVSVTLIDGMEIAIMVALEPNLMVSVTADHIITSGPADFTINN